ncbi:MAG: glycine zipper 2TM domain-containing protein [Burkholderiales bacterium]|nr:glycine zipper 2TM domain-containing protein [Burkholderiales bacterium]
MKRLALAALAATAALGVHAEPYFDHARVRSVEPQYDSVSVPREECRRHPIDERRRAGPERDPGGLVVGGVLGALLGNQVGKGHGREAATAVGAVVGAVAGDHLANRHRWEPADDPPREVVSCRTVNELSTRIVGYRVTYDYHGQQFTTVMREPPGPHLRVRVSVDPV